jgi:hypothetical protein
MLKKKGKLLLLLTQANSVLVFPSINKKITLKYFEKNW